VAPFDPNNPKDLASWVPMRVVQLLVVIKKFKTTHSQNFEYIVLFFLMSSLR
jgi:hypothetical protein